MKVLDEVDSFLLQGRPLNPDEESYYDLPVQPSAQSLLVFINTLLCVPFNMA